MKRIAIVGECLIELNGAPFGTLHQTFGGDSLNTALYLARLSGKAVVVNYVTALGTDAFSDGMLSRWAAEGIDTGLVLRDATRLPGLYMIQIDAHGERTFLYWRDQSAARYLFQHPQFETVSAQLAGVDWVFVTGISLAILPVEDRRKLVALLAGLAQRGVGIAFDTNYRPRLWSSPEVAREVVASVLPHAKLVFATYDDEQQLWGDASPQITLQRLFAAGASQVILKLGAEGCLFGDGHDVIHVPTLPVAATDTTAAGDAFNAAFLAALLSGHDAHSCCRAGNTLAGIVIQHKGAIIPAAATPTLATCLSQPRIS